VKISVFVRAIQRQQLVNDGKLAGDNFALDTRAKGADCGKEIWPSSELQKTAESAHECVEAPG
jgi:hypothetical protein